MVRREHFTVHPMGQQNSLVWVHDPVHFHRSSVISVWLYQSVTTELLGISIKLTSLSAPSMHTYRAFLFGMAFRITSDIGTPVHTAVETPAAPHEKPLVLRTTFCSFRLFPAQTKVTGYVTCSYSSRRCRSDILNGLLTRLHLFSHDERGNVPRSDQLTLQLRIPSPVFQDRRLLARHRGFSRKTIRDL